MHKTQGTLSIIPAVKRKPFLFMGRELYNTVSYLVNHKKFATKEVQWYHCVTKHEDDEGNICYKLTGIIIPPQTVSSTEADTTVEQQLQVYYEIRAMHTDEEGDTDQDATNAFVASMTCWNHSHVNMGVNPSGQDNSQFKDFIINNDKVDADQIFIMMIWNRKGNLYTRIYDPALGYCFESVPLRIEDEDTETDYVEDAIKNKIEEKKWTQARHWPGQYSNLHVGGSGNAPAPKGASKGNPEYNSMKGYPSTMDTLVRGTTATQPINTEIYNGTLTDKEGAQILTLIKFISKNQKCAAEAQELALLVGSILDTDGSAIKAYRHLLTGAAADRAVLNRWQVWENREWDAQVEIALLTEVLIEGWFPLAEGACMAISIADALAHCTRLSEVVSLVSSHFDLIETLEQEIYDQIPEMQGQTT